MCIYTSIPSPGSRPTIIGKWDRDHISHKKEANLYQEPHIRHSKPTTSRFTGRHVYHAMTAIWLECTCGAFAKYLHHANTQNETHTPNRIGRYSERCLPNAGFSSRGNSTHTEIKPRQSPPGDRGRFTQYITNVIEILLLLFCKCMIPNKVK